MQTLVVKYTHHTVVAITGSSPTPRSGIYYTAFYMYMSGNIQTDMTSFPTKKKTRRPEVCDDQSDTICEFISHMVGICHFDIGSSDIDTTLLQC